MIRTVDRCCPEIVLINLHPIGLQSHGKDERFASPVSNHTLCPFFTGLLEGE